MSLPRVLILFGDEHHPGGYTARVYIGPIWSDKYDSVELGAETYAEAVIEMAKYLELTPAYFRRAWLVKQPQDILYAATRNRDGCPVEPSIGGGLCRIADAIDRCGANKDITIWQRRPDQHWEVFETR